MKSQMTVGKKVGVLSASLVLCCMLVGGAALAGIGSLERSISKLTADSLPGVDAMGKIAASTNRFRGDAWKHIASTDAAAMARTEGEMEDLKRETEKQLVAYDATVFEADDRANTAELRENLARYYAAWQNDVIALSRQSKNAEAYDAYIKSVDPAYRALTATVTKMQQWNSDGGKRGAEEATSTIAATRVAAMILLGIALVAGSLSSLWVVRGLNHRLRTSVKSLSESAEQVASASTQIASSSQALAQGASEQAASLEETSASTEEINSMARRNTENSRSAADLVTSSQHQFEVTGRSLEEMVGAMNEIKSSSDKIAKIIKVIEEIAFQTNILALNAAVEAARAGEAGMGFAVVADEVRNLAQRCAQAAQDTASLIEESIAKSNHGKLKVDQVVVAIQSITEESSKVKILVDEVNVGSQEQARGIDEIGRAITQMEHVTQNSAASAEESAAAAQELSSQSEKLKRVVQDLISMVEGGEATADQRPGSHRKTPLARVSAHPPLHDGEFGAGMAGFHSAFDNRPAAGAPQPAFSGARAAKNDFPLDDDFPQA